MNTLVRVVTSALLIGAILDPSAVMAQQGGPCLLGVGNCPQGQGQVANPPVPATAQGNVDPGRHSVHITDARAAEIVDALNNNARYLLVLQQYYDPNIGQLCEERAWVGGSFGGDASQVVVQVGPTAKVCYDPSKTVWTAQQINQTERAIDTWVDAIYQWTKYEEGMAYFLNQNRNDPQAVAYAQSEIARAQAWGKYYRDGITANRNVINMFAPPSN